MSDEFEPAPARPRASPPSRLAVKAFEERHQRRTERDALIVGAFSVQAGEYSELRETLVEMLDGYLARQAQLDRMQAGAEGEA